MLKEEYIINWSEKDECYVGKCSEFPECMANGETYEECLRKLEESLQVMNKEPEVECWEISKPKGLFSSMLPFLIYSSVIFLLMLIGIFIPNSADIMWLWLWGFYMPYIFAGIYIISFILGLYTQKRSNTKKLKIQLMLTLISFFITLLNILITTWIFMMSYSLGQKLVYFVYPVIGSSILFFVAQVITMHIQRKCAAKQSCHN